VANSSSARQRHFESTVVEGAQSDRREQSQEGEDPSRYTVLAPDHRLDPFAIGRAVQKARFAGELLRTYGESTCAAFRTLRTQLRSIFEVGSRILSPCTTNQIVT
jgi:hypothetical protein